LLMVTVEGGVRLVRLHSSLQAYDSQVSVVEDVPTTVIFQASIGNNGSLQYDIVTPPQHGQLTGSGTTRTYTPAPNYFGSDAITFSVRYGEAIRHRTVSLNVLAQNDAPVAVNDTATMKRNGSINLLVLGNDYDIEGDTLSLASVSTPTSGTAKIIGNAITFTPAKSFTGLASFSYTIQDGKGGSASATVSVTVNK
jgi:large repetitive protein